MSRRRLKLGALFFLTLMLAGCSEADLPPINPNGGFWDRFFVYPLSASMDWFASHLWGQYGLSILIVTIIIRFLILPLSIKQYRSSRKMQEIQPELLKIREKYKDNLQKQQEEMMKLYQREGVNPMAGCLPLLIQMPILIALYNAIMRNEEIRQHAFLWMQLGQPDPFFILPLLAALTTYLQQKVMQAQMKNNPMPQMKVLFVILPVLIFVMAMNFASALPLYWIYSNIFTIVQTYFMYRPAKNLPAKN